MSERIVPQREDCDYASCYCEENVWKLCQRLQQDPYELQQSYAVFISNPDRTVPLWSQKAGRGAEKVLLTQHLVLLTTLSY